MVAVRDLLAEATARLRDAGSTTARLDAEVLLAYAIGTDRTALIAHPDAPVGVDAAASFRAALERGAAGEPVAYIRGFKEFLGIALAADARALIPRPETELLVELAAREAVRRLAAAPRPPGTPPFRVADVGTGSGTIAVGLAVLLRREGALGEVTLLATDISADALALARENAVAHGVADRIAFEEADLLPAYPAASAGAPGPGRVPAPFDLVLANLPYVRTDAIPGLPVATSFEPVLALDGGPEGLDQIGRLLDRLPDGLARDGLALLEIGADQGEAVVTLVGERLPGWTCRVLPDLAGLPRVAAVRRT